MRTSSVPPAASTVIGGEADHHDRIPADIRASLTAEQLTRLGALLAAPAAQHALAYRLSTKLFGRRVYLAVLSGTESRSPSRIGRAGELVSGHGFLLRLVMVSGWVTLTAVTLTLAAAVALYLAKSWLGIDLMDGPSPLHRWFFD